MENRPHQEYAMYKNRGAYDHKGRWLSYYYQYKKVIALDPKRILEVGPGNGTTSDYLRRVGFDVTTVDYEAALQPDYVADVTNLPFKDKEFDVALCCEVLEHIPFSEFPVAIKELNRVAKKVLVTVPDHRRVPFSISLKIPFFEFFYWSLRMPTFKKHVFNDFHYWEIGKSDYPLSKICASIESQGVTIIDHASPHDVPLIHYFMMES